MNAKTIRVTVTAAYRDGSSLMHEQLVPADTILREPRHLDSGHTIQAIDLRLMLPKSQVEDLLAGLRTGNVEILIDGMRSSVERAAAA